MDMSRYQVKESRPLPLMLLLDVSGSMSENNKITSLNHAVRTMLQQFKTFKSGEQEIKVLVITFGSKVDIHMNYTSASDAESSWHDLDAHGGTPLGTALRLAKDIIEDKSMTPSKSYTPIVVLVSDGQPTDKWDDDMKAFITSGRSQKAMRMAMAIGQDADTDILGQFIAGSTDINGDPVELFFAHDASRIPEFFKLVTMSAQKGTSRRKVPAPSGNADTNTNTNTGNSNKDYGGGFDPFA